MGKKSMFYILFAGAAMAALLYGTAMTGEAAKNCTVTCYANNGTDASDVQSVAEGSDYTLSDDIFAYGRCEIESWNTEADGSGYMYDVNEEVTVTEDISLYAQWVLPLNKYESFSDEDYEWSGNEGSLYSFTMKNGAVLYGGVVFPAKTNDDRVTITVEDDCAIRGSLSFADGTGSYGSSYRGNLTIQGDGMLELREISSTGAGDMLTILTDVMVASDYMFLGASGGADSHIYIKDAELTLHDLTLLQYLTMEGNAKLNIASGTASFHGSPEFVLSEQSEIYIGGNGNSCVLYKESGSNDAFDTLITEGWLPEGYSFKEENYGYYLYDAENNLEIDAVTIKKKVPETVMPTPTEEDTFDDVKNEWYAPYIKYVYKHNLMNGIEGTRLFEPNANITKAQIAQILYNMEERPEVTDTKVFVELGDVYTEEWYADAVAWAYSTGVITGDLVRMKFFPNSDATREQLALMMYRYARFKEYDISATSDFSGLQNADKVAEWSVHGVKWAVGAKIINGVETESGLDLDPQGTATRAQMAAILERFCEYYSK